MESEKQTADGILINASINFLRIALAKKTEYLCHIPKQQGVQNCGCVFILNRLFCQ